MHLDQLAGDVRTRQRRNVERLLRRACRIGKVDELVGMAHAVARPRRMGRPLVADQQDHVVRRFAAVYPLRNPVRCLGAVAQPVGEHRPAQRPLDRRGIENRHPAVALETGREAGQETDAVDATGRRHQGDDARPRPRSALRERRPDTFDDEAGDTHRDQRIGADHLLVAIAPQPHQQAVAHGDDSGGAWLAGHQRYLAQRLAAPHVAENLGLAQLIFAQHAQVAQHQLQEGFVKIAEGVAQGSAQPVIRAHRLDAPTPFLDHVISPVDCRRCTVLLLPSACTGGRRRYSAQEAALPADLLPAGTQLSGDRAARHRQCQARLPASLWYGNCLAQVH